MRGQFGSGQPSGSRAALAKGGRPCNVRDILVQLALPSRENHRPPARAIPEARQSNLAALWNRGPSLPLGGKDAPTPRAMSHGPPGTYACKADVLIFVDLPKSGN